MKILTQIAMLTLVAVLVVSGRHPKHPPKHAVMLHQSGYSGPSIANLRGAWTLP